MSAASLSSINQVPSKKPIINDDKNSSTVKDDKPVLQTTKSDSFEPSKLSNGIVKVGTGIATGTLIYNLVPTALIGIPGAFLLGLAAIFPDKPAKILDTMGNVSKNIGNAVKTIGWDYTTGPVLKYLKDVGKYSINRIGNSSQETKSQESSQKQSVAVEEEPEEIEEPPKEAPKPPKTEDEKLKEALDSLLKK